MLACLHAFLHYAIKNRCAAAESKIKEMIDEVTQAFDGHLEDAAAAAKQHFRWIKRRYREKIDVNRIAAKIELKVRGDGEGRRPRFLICIAAYCTR